MKKTTTKRTCKGVDEQNLNVVAQENVAMTNKGKATFRLPTVRLLALTVVLLLAFATCKEDPPETEPEKAQHSPNVTMFADKTATITTNDTFTDTQWNAIVTAIVGKFDAAYDDEGNDNIKLAYRNAFEISGGATIIVEKNPTTYTNYKVAGRILYIRSDKVDTLNTIDIITALINNTPLNAKALPANNKRSIA
jgi:hypothetical protein